MLDLPELGLGLGLGFVAAAHVGLKLALGGALQDRAPYPR